MYWTYPGFISHWKHGRHAARCGDRSIGVGAEGRHFSGEEEGEFGGGFPPFGFGVRRPLRFLAYKLQLDDAQVSELARILDEIKTERAQAAVDHRRAISAFADAIEGEAFDAKKAEAGATVRMQSAERLRSAVLSALERLHKLLKPEQRTRLAYLIRTGAVSI